jgi:hypothetical protein
VQYTIARGEPTIETDKEVERITKSKEEPDLEPDQTNTLMRKPQTTNPYPKMLWGRATTKTKTLSFRHATQKPSL